MMTYRKINGSQLDQIDRHKDLGWTSFEPVEVDIKAVYIEGIHESFKWICKLWEGNKCKPVIYGFTDDQKLKDYLLRSIEKRKEHHQKKIERRQSNKVDAKDFWSVGDVMSYSWGYDQTNVDFFQVVEVLKASVRVRRISQNNSDNGGSLGGYCQPRRNEFIGDPILKRVRRNGYISFEFGCGSKWDGSPCYTSSYH